MMKQMLKVLQEMHGFYSFFTRRIYVSFVSDLTKKFHLRLWAAVGGSLGKKAETDLETSCK